MKFSTVIVLFFSVACGPKKVSNPITVFGHFDFSKDQDPTLLTNTDGSQMWGLVTTDDVTVGPAGLFGQCVSSAGALPQCINGSDDAGTHTTVEDGAWVSSGFDTIVDSRPFRDWPDHTEYTIVYEATGTNPTAAAWAGPAPFINFDYTDPPNVSDDNGSQAAIGCWASIGADGTQTVSLMYQYQNNEGGTPEPYDNNQLHTDSATGESYYIEDPNWKLYVIHQVTGLPAGQKITAKVHFLTDTHKAMFWVNGKYEGTFSFRDKAYFQGSVVGSPNNDRYTSLATWYDYSGVSCPTSGVCTDQFAAVGKIYSYTIQQNPNTPAAADYTP